MLATYEEGLLALGLPDSAYCDASRISVARDHKWFPSYKEVADGVETWWRASQPAPLPRLVGPGGVHLTAVDEHWVKYWQQRITEDDCQSWGKRRHLMHLIRERSMNAYGYLVTTDDLAARIAVAEGWLRGSKPVETAEDLAERMQAEWANPEDVRRMVSKVLADRDGTPEREAHVARCLALLRGILTKWAPHNLDLVPGGGVVVQ
jgi:hypothetical protein